MSKVLAVIGARLNSSRLPGKQLLDLAGKPLMERIFQRLEKIPQLSQIILATTADDYNQPLIQWAQHAGKQVFAFDGDVNDLLGRVDALVQLNRPEVVVYFCGDSPLIEPSTVANMIQALLDDPKADYVALENGINNQKSIHVGFCAYSRRVWKQIVEHVTTPEEREHVGTSVNRFIQQL